MSGQPHETDQVGQDMSEAERTEDQRQPAAVLRVGTRGSALARTQTTWAADRVAEAAGVSHELEIIRTEGDVLTGSLATLGGTGVFAAALRVALLEDRVDMAVHSLKDLPTAPTPGLSIGAVPEREDPRDALCARDGLRLEQLPDGAKVGTGSPRRAAQLLLARPDADDTALVDALRRVGADDWVTALPDGLDTVVGERGQVLGPVEAQQVALARVLLIDPPVVILDEATAEAGPGGGSVLDEAAWNVVRGRTAVVIAHRLDQAARADEVWLMESGRIVERGSHRELVEQGGAYADLWAAWSRGR